MQWVASLELAPHSQRAKWVGTGQNFYNFPRSNHLFLLSPIHCWVVRKPEDFTTLLPPVVINDFGQSAPDDFQSRQQDERQECEISMSYQIGQTSHQVSKEDIQGDQSTNICISSLTRSCSQYETGIDISCSCASPVPRRRSQPAQCSHTGLGGDNYRRPLSAVSHHWQLLQNLINYPATSNLSRRTVGE